MAVMRSRVHLTERDLAQLEQLRERALTCRALKFAAKEAELERDELVAALMNRVSDAGTRVAEAALLTRGWPSKIRDYYSVRYMRWRSEHPDRQALLIEARDRLALMLGGDDGA
jgi:hypothetical protein